MNDTPKPSPEILEAYHRAEMAARKVVTKKEKAAPDTKKARLKELYRMQQEQHAEFLRRSAIQRKRLCWEILSKSMVDKP